MFKTIFRYLTSVVLYQSLVLPAVCGHAETILKPVIVTRPVRYDSDDPAIWMDRADPAKSLVIGTDKNVDGSLFVFDLSGAILENRCVHGLNRPNNVDVEYGLILKGKPVDIVVVTERGTNKLRIYQLPDMNPIDNGGIPVFEGENLREPMGIALYRRKSDGNIYAVVSRKKGPTEGYLWQYLLQDDGSGVVKGTKVRAFGKWSGKKEIEAIAVDDLAEVVYYSDERFGIRKYKANPDAENADRELAIFGQSGFAADQEGIAVYDNPAGGVMVIVSDQGGGALRVYGSNSIDADQYRFLDSVPFMATETDGIDLCTTIRTSAFPEGLLVAMSNDHTFQYYSMKELLRHISNGGKQTR